MEEWEKNQITRLAGNNVEPEPSVIRVAERSIGTKREVSGTKGKLTLIKLSEAVDEVLGGTKTTGDGTRQIAERIFESIREKGSPTAKKEMSEARDDEGIK